MASKARVLAVDDQLYFRTFIEGLLREEGYTVETARDGPSALEWLSLRAAATTPPCELVITDLFTPGTRGIEFVRELRGRYPGLPVIVLSSVGDVNAVVGAMRSGAADYLLKPIHRERLVQAIEAVLERQRVRIENERLVDENLEMFGALSLFERALPMLERTDVEAVATNLLELLCRELRAESGVLFVRESLELPLVLRAGRGDLPFDDGGTTWTPERAESGARAAAVLRGEPCLTPSGVLLVPCTRDGLLLAVAELHGRSEAELRERARESAARLGRLGAIALWNASRVAAVSSAALREPRTGLPGLAYLEQALETEVHRARRFGRRLSLLQVELRALGPAGAMQRVQSAVEALASNLRNTDVLCAEDPLSYFVLASDTDTLGGLVLKRRLAERVREVVGASGERTLADLPAIGAASFPVDGETCGALLERARAGAAREHASPVHALGLGPRSGLGKIASRVLEQATLLPGSFVLDALEIVTGDLRCRPHDRGLLFLAPGPEVRAFQEPLASLATGDSATEVLVATRPESSRGGEIASRASPAVTVLRLPRELPADTSWIVRLGEAPPYLLIAGPPDADQKRPVYHTGDPLLVEYVVFRLRGELGFGVGRPCA